MKNLFGFPFQPQTTGKFIFGVGCCSHSHGMETAETETASEEAPKEGIPPEEYGETRKHIPKLAETGKAPPHEVDAEATIIEEIWEIKDNVDKLTKITDANELKAELDYIQTELGDINNYSRATKDLIKTQIKSLDPELLQELFVQSNGDTHTIQGLGKGTITDYYVAAENLFTADHIKKDGVIYERTEDGYYTAGGDKLSIGDGDTLELFDKAKQLDLLEATDKAFDTETRNGNEELIYNGALNHLSRNQALEQIHLAFTEEECHCTVSGEKHGAKKARLATAAYLLATASPEDLYSDVIQDLPDNHESGLDHVFNAPNGSVSSVFRLGAMGKKDQPYIQFIKPDGSKEEAVRMNYNGTPGYYFWNGTEVEKINVQNGFTFSYIDKESASDEIAELNSKPALEDLAKKNWDINASVLQNITKADYDAYLSQASDAMGSQLIRANAMTNEAKSLLSDSERSFYENINNRYNTWRKQGTIDTPSTEIENINIPLSQEEKNIISDDLIGLEVSEDQIVGRNSDGTIKIKASSSSEATFDYDVPNQKAIVRSKSANGSDFIFETGSQSKYPLQFFAQLAHHGNSDVLDEERGGQAIENTWRMSDSHLKDLFSADGTQYFREGQVAELANTFFHLGGKSIFDMIAALEISDGETTDTLTKDQMITPGSFAKHKNTILSFLENMGDRVITADSLIQAQKSGNGKIRINKQGQLA